MGIAEEIIAYIKHNRVSTTEVADALGKSGVLTDVLPLTAGMFKVGKTKCVFTANESNYDLHEQIRSIQHDEIVLFFAHNCEKRALFGELVAKFLLLYQGAEAVVVDGLIRDAAALMRQRFSIWSRGSTPLGCFNKKTDPYPEEKKKEILSRYENGIAVCDDGGVVVIPPDKINKQMLERLHRIEMQEDIWFFCLDHLKWDTKKIVCDKDYLKETELLSSIHINQLAELKKPLDK
jgi:4-hydroxy-4-methyl-2-oxoglutarate aldolase